MKNQRYSTALFAFSLCLLACNAPEDEDPAIQEPVEECTVAGPQVATQTGGVGFIIQDTLHWEFLHADDSTLVFKRASCPEDEEPPPPALPRAGLTISPHSGHILVEKLSIAYDDSALRFQAGPDTYNIHGYRKNDSLGYEAYSRTVEGSENGPCEVVPGSCHVPRYEETFIFFAGHVLRVASPDILKDSPELLQLFRALAFTEAPLDDPQSIAHLKFQRDNVTVSMRDSVPSYLYMEYPSYEEKAWIQAFAGSLGSEDECATYPGMSFHLEPFCRLRYRIIHPVD